MTTKQALLGLVGFVGFSAVVGFALPRILPPPPSNKPLIGALYSVDNADGGYRIIKVLAADKSTIHVRLYGNHFARRPKHLNPAELSLAPGVVRIQGVEATVRAAHRPPIRGRAPWLKRLEQRHRTARWLIVIGRLTPRCSGPHPGVRPGSAAELRHR